jgi:hypothetical protein
MRPKHVSVCSILLGGVLVMVLTARGAAAAESCSAAVQAAKAEWRSVSHGAHVAPAQQILTSDGRRLTGSAINYAFFLISRAERACEAAQIDVSIGYVREARALFHPPPRPL